MAHPLKIQLKRFLHNTKLKTAHIAIRWTRTNKGSMLFKKFGGPGYFPHINKYSARIEGIARATNKGGRLPLWQGYGQKDATRGPDQVRSDWVSGNFFTEIVNVQSPEVIVEFGSAFGVSGMYWLAGVNLNGKGFLFTFEPNSIWSKTAKANLERISTKFLLTEGTFEDNVRPVLGDKKIDLAFIDAIHTPEFVQPQLEIVIAHSRPGTVIVLDDVNFSPEMTALWEKVATEPRFTNSFLFGDRIGILELA